MEREILFVEWVSNYIERLVRIANSYVNDQATAEDRVQDALIKAYEAFHRLQNVENPFPWLVSIVINECKSFYRKKWREIVASVLPEKRAPSAEETFLKRSEFEDVHHAVLLLPEKYRIPIVLFHFEGMSIQEITEVLAIQSGTVKTRLARGRQRLQIILEGCEKDELRRETSRGKTV